MERLITVYKKYYNEFNRPRNKQEFVPWISFQGQYLAKYGFEPGDKLKVTIEENKIVIERTVDKS